MRKLDYTILFIFFRSIYFWMVFVFATIPLSICSVMAGLFDKSGDTSHRINRLWGKVLIEASGSKLVVRGKENVNHDKPYLIISNHQSVFDIYALMYAIDNQQRWIGKDTLFRIPFMGWAMSAARYISIKRERKRSAYNSIISAAECGKKGKSIVIFPEGTRSLDGLIHPFKKGALLILSAVDMEILPVTIHGTYPIMPKGTFWLHPQTITLIISPPLRWNKKTSALKEGDFLESIRQTIIKNYNTGENI